MASVVQACPLDPCPQLRAEAAKLKRFDSNAQAAAAAYDPPDKRIPPKGYRNATKGDLAKLNLTPEMIEHPYNAKDKANSQFRAAVFIKEKSDSLGISGQPLIAFKGSDSPLFGEDGANNRQQFLNQDSFYYSQAQKIATAVKSSPGGSGASFAGHSLGGGLASAASRSTGLDAVTFNAAALQEKTVPQPDTNGRIDAIFVRGDPLSGLQERFSNKTSGTNEFPLDPPQGLGARLASKGAWYDVRDKVRAFAARQKALHGIDTVQQSLGERAAQNLFDIKRNGC